jgi:hypothetical protein
MSRNSIVLESHEDEKKEKKKRWPDVNSRAPSTDEEGRHDG